MIDNVTFEVLEGNEIAIIDKGNDEFVSMPKAEYERHQAEQSTPMVSADE